MVCVAHMGVEMIQGTICFVATRVIACVIAVDLFRMSSGAFDVFWIDPTRSPLSGNAGYVVIRGRYVGSSVQGLRCDTCNYIVWRWKWSTLDVTLSDLNLTDCLFCVENLKGFW